MLSARRPRQSTRAKIFDAICDNPGIHKSDLGKATSFSWGTLSHHVSVLSRQGKIRCIRTQGKLRLFAADLESGQDDVWAALRVPLSSEISRELSMQPGQQLMDLSRRLNASRKQVRRTLTHLEGAGLVRGEGNHRRRYTLIAPRSRMRQDPRHSTNAELHSRLLDHEELE